MQCAVRAWRLCPSSPAVRRSSFSVARDGGGGGQNAGGWRRCRRRRRTTTTTTKKLSLQPRQWRRRGGSAVCAGDGELREASAEPTEDDKSHMRHALELAATATGKTFPNPVVGCVIVDPSTGEIVGEGFHPKAGEPHAEVFALRAAGDRARGATAYVSLEPCNHFGRTPPCSRALVDAGVSRVVVGFVDPDPRVSGGGIKTLLDAGIEVVVGCEEDACREINADFIQRNTST